MPTISEPNQLSNKKAAHFECSFLVKWSMVDTQLNPV